MIVYVGDYWIDGALALTVGCLAVLLASLWWASRRLRANRSAVAKTLGKASASPSRSGLRGGR
jgi:hypothetical protein